MGLSKPIHTPWLGSARASTAVAFTLPRLPGRAEGSPYSAPAASRQRAYAASLHVAVGVVARAGIDPREFSGHSLRAGFATSAGAARVPESGIARQTRHKNRDALAGYMRESDAFERDAAAAVL
jgi:integrase